ncbi:MAG: imidazoleglycerol-phosphate dehydratase HisB [Clostridia bacterium]|nr:imidazoleglycerol-phosphate dehydratase HisB [Clostridia bacterium]
MRTAEIKRKTGETDISLTLNIDGSGKSNIDSGCGFLDHMLTLFAKHGRFDLTVKCIGDTHVDDHHTVEDIGISLGIAFKEALADKKGIVRYGSMILPMDEALILSAVDFSGRGYLGYSMDIPTEKVGTFDTELVEEFWLGFIRNAECTLHIRQLAGTNSHHIIEGVFKSVGHSFRKACKIDSEFSQDVLSTKGVL